MKARTICAALIFLVNGSLCLAQGKAATPVLKVEQNSSGPLGGEKEASCLTLYSDGRAVSASFSKAGVEIRDEHGKVTRPESGDSREYRFPERDSWQVSEFVEFLQSKAVKRLNSYFPPPHRPIDFVEISTVQVFFPDGTNKQIVTREYYVASLIEKTKYPSALVLLMDRIEQLEGKVSEKGTPVAVPPECKFEQGPEPGSKKQP
jgi:hypothetical protein